jgi:nitroreductase
MKPEFMTGEEKMDFFELIDKRYSVRSYLSDPVEDSKLRQVLDAARMAPTAANRQPFQLIVVHTAGKIVELGKVYSAGWLAEAPLLICACSMPSQGWKHFHTGKNYCEVDVAIVMDHLILAASSLGLGTCWIAAFNHAELKRMLRLPDELEPVVLTPLGYPADHAEPKIRRPLEELVRYEQWHD